MVIVDGDSGKIVQANAAAYGLLGAPLIGQPLERFIPESDQQAHKEHRRDYMQVPAARPMGVGIEVRAITKGGAEVVVEIALTPIQMTRMILAEIDPVVEAT
jgi:PAS domain S-box-containing protein